MLLFQEGNRLASLSLDANRMARDTWKFTQRAMGDAYRFHGLGF